MENLFTSKAAKEFSKEGRIEEWIHSFLNDEGNNVAFSEGLKLEKRSYIGPLRMPLNLFKRCCGPEEDMEYRIDKGGFEWRVSEIQKRMEGGWDVPPLIVNFSDSTFQLNDGNHRYQAMINKGIEEYEVIIWMTGQADYQSFLDLYSNYNGNNT